MKQGLPQVAEHKVVVLSITYNQAEYIEDTLKGFVAQHTDFPFLCCVFDDASTDGEKDVLRHWIHSHCNAEEVEEYDHPLTSILMGADKVNPNCIYVFHLLKVNSYGKPGKAELLNYWRNHGKYVAMCEGDDYWTDPLKLQKQVDFLESHPDYVMCTHRFQILSEETKEFKEDWNGRFKDGLHFDLAHFMERNSWVTQPLTLLYRRSSLNLDEYNKYKNSKDVTLMYYLLQQGKGLLMPDFMGVYRVHKGGVWQGVDRSKKIKAELDTVMAIYDVEKSKQAATLVKNSMRYFRYLGWPFFKHYFKIYARAINIICRELGLVEALKAVCRSIKFF